MSAPRQPADIEIEIAELAVGNMGRTQGHEMVAAIQEALATAFGHGDPGAGAAGPRARRIPVLRAELERPSATRDGTAVGVALAASIHGAITGRGDAGGGGGQP